LMLTIEKPAVGGRMIARADRQIVLVDGAIPGERVAARIERIARGVVYAETLNVEEASLDRREPFADRSCGGCLYGHIAYPRQLEIKSMVIADAFARIGRVFLPNQATVAPSPPEGYRMRARLHYRGRQLGFFREGTHTICDARTTRQLLPGSCDALDRVGAALAGLPETFGEVEISENVDASERVISIDASATPEASWSDVLSEIHDVTGIIVAYVATGAVRLVAGSAYLSDALQLDNGKPITLRRHGLAFFQGNRFLLRDLVFHVMEQIPSDSRIVDLYAGGGLFSVAAAHLRGSRVIAVEGDRMAAQDLAVNAAATRGAVVAVHGAIETVDLRAAPKADVVLVDPPRTGMTSEAAQRTVRLGARRVVYVSCDVATLARDTRRFVDGGYELERVDAFDMFPHTPHVEVVAVLDRV